MSTKEIEISQNLTINSTATAHKIFQNYSFLETVKPYSIEICWI